jgi:hypothetical protein
LQDDFNLFVIEGYGHKEIAVMLEHFKAHQITIECFEAKGISKQFVQKQIVMDNQEKYSKIKNASQKQEEKTLQWKSLDARRKIDEKKTKKLFFGKN